MRPIDADELKVDYIVSSTTTNTPCYRYISKEQIDNALTIDQVKHGKWVYKGARGRFPVCECSVCGNAENADWAILGDNVNYCPNCGAKMDKED